MCSHGRNYTLFIIEKPNYLTVYTYVSSCGNLDHRPLTGDVSYD